MPMLVDAQAAQPFARVVQIERPDIYVRRWRFGHRDTIPSPDLPL
jgi:hypothetical protein